MQSSLTIGGIEVALSTPAGALEAAVAGRYASFLGAVEAPVCSLTLEARQGAEGPPTPDTTLVERVGETTFQVVHPGLSGWFDLAGAGVVDIGAHPYALDNALRLLFGLLAPCHEALMLHATSVISNGGVHIFTGPADTSTLTSPAGDPVLTDGLVLVRREAGGWLGASTPFWAAYEKPGAPREAKLSHLWSLISSEQNLAGVSNQESACSAVVTYAFVPTADPEFGRLALGLATGLSEDIPFSHLRFAGGPAVWNTIGTVVG